MLDPFVSPDYVGDALPCLRRSSRTERLLVTRDNVNLLIFRTAPLGGLWPTSLVVKTPSFERFTARCSLGTRSFLCFFFFFFSFFSLRVGRNQRSKLKILSSRDGVNNSRDTAGSRAQIFHPIRAEFRFVVPKLV